MECVCSRSCCVAARRWQPTRPYLGRPLRAAAGQRSVPYSPALRGYASRRRRGGGIILWARRRRDGRTSRRHAVAAAIARGPPSRREWIRATATTRVSNQGEFPHRWHRGATGRDGQEPGYVQTYFRYYGRCVCVVRGAHIQGIMNKAVKKTARGFDHESARRRTSRRSRTAAGTPSVAPAMART